MTAYADFLASKARDVGAVGHEIDVTDVHPMLHPWQAMMKPGEMHTEAGRCLARALAVLDAVHRLASRWEAAGDQARADELRSAVRAAISEATDEAGRTDVCR